MIAASLVGTALGAVLGFRSTVLVLVPAVLLGTVAALGGLILGHLSGQQAGIDLLGWVLGVETGYAAVVSVVIGRSDPAQPR